MKVLIGKEIHQGIMSLRYLLILVLTISIFTASGLFFIKKFTDRRNDYNEQVLENRKNLEENAQHLNSLAPVNQYLIRPPLQTELFASGSEKYLSDRIGFTMFRYAGYDNIDRLNYKINPFNDLDWVFIVGLILSFAALVLTFDSISGEKERGTLRLQCSYSLSRFKLIIAKYLSSLILMTIALICGIVVNLIIVTIGLNTSLITLHPVQILISIFLFLFYISIFLLLGLFISSQVRKSASSLALALLVWTTFLIFIPAGGSMLAEKINPIRSSYEYSETINNDWNEIWMNCPVKEARGFWNGRDFPYLADRVKLVNQLDDMLNKHRAERFKELLGQVRNARNLTFISPYALLRHAMESVAGTGLDAFVRFYERGKIYRSIFGDFVKQKDQEDPGSTHNICAWHAIAYSDKPVQMEEIPKFQAPKLSAGGAVLNARLSLFLLLCFNLIGAILAFIAFMRYDVR
jgi:ABC-type transport system involved in multi-copper enzyme maturation permease subunit